MCSANITLQVLPQVTPKKAFLTQSAQVPSVRGLFVIESTTSLYAIAYKLLHTSSLEVEDVQIFHFILILVRLLRVKIVPECDFLLKLILRCLTLNPLPLYL